MLRNSIIYRRFNYARKRNTVNIHIISKLISFIIIFLLILTYVQKILIPQLNQVTQNCAKDVFSEAVNAVINDSFIDISQNNAIVSPSFDSQGNLKLLQLDSLKVKKLSITLSKLIDKKLGAVTNNNIAIPLGSLSGIILLSKLGPTVHIRYSPFHTVETSVISTLSNNTVNPQAFSLLIKVKSSITVTHPLSEKEIDLSIDIPVSESILYP